MEMILKIIKKNIQPPKKRQTPNPIPSRLKPQKKMLIYLPSSLADCHH